MIQLKNYTPAVYYEESRDFQLLGHLYDILFNAVKTQTDLLYTLPNSSNSPEELLELGALTIGLQPQKDFDAIQLKAICAVFPQLLRKKGSVEAILLACRALFYAEGNTSKPIVTELIDEQSKSITGVQVYVPAEIQGVTLLQKILDYIIPAGLSCSIIRQQTTELNTGGLKFKNSQYINYAVYKANDLNQFAKVYKSDKELNSLVHKNQFLIPGEGVKQSISGTVGLGRVYKSTEE